MSLAVISVVIPCHNEVANVPKLRDELLPVICTLGATSASELIFVDDGSTDGTLDALIASLGQEERAEVRFVSHRQRMGLGAALRTGFSAAKGEVIVTSDSDGTYHFSNIPALVSCLTPDVDIVTASPYHPEGGVAGVAPHRLFLSKASSTLYRLLVDSKVHTYTALFRAYRRSVVESVPFFSNDFLSVAEILVKAMLLGFEVAEFPTVLHARSYGASKAKLLRVIGAHSLFHGQVLLHRMRLKSLVPPKTSAMEA